MQIVLEEKNEIKLKLAMILKFVIIASLVQRVIF